MKLSGLVPLLRPATRPQQAWRAAVVDPDRALVRQRFVPFLHVVLAEDLNDRLKFVGVGELRDAGLHANIAFDQARRNLDPTPGLSREGALWRLTAGDGYEASRLALPGWLAAWGDTLGSRPLAVVPHSREILVGTEAETQELLDRAASGWGTAGNPISPAIYTVADDKRVVPWVPDPAHPHRIAVVNAHKALAQREYEEQRRTLEDLVEGAVFARAGLLTDEATGALVTVAAWTQGTRPLLPLVDMVVLHPKEGGERWVPWTHIADVLEPWPSLEPPRFRPARWQA